MNDNKILIYIEMLFGYLIGQIFVIKREGAILHDINAVKFYTNVTIYFNKY